MSPASMRWADVYVSGLGLTMGRRLPGVHRECRRGPLSTRVRPLFGSFCGPRPS